MVRSFIVAAMLVVAGCSSSPSGDPVNCSDGTYSFTLTLDHDATCPKYPLLKRIRISGREVAVTYADAAGAETLVTTCVIFAGAGTCLLDVECDSAAYVDAFPVGGQQGSGIFARGGRGGTCATYADVEWKRIN